LIIRPAAISSPHETASSATTSALLNRPSPQHREQQRIDLRPEDHRRVRHHVGADAAVGRGKLGFELRRDRLGLRPGLADGDVGVETGDQLVGGPLPARARQRIDGQRDPQRFADREREPVGHDADDRARDAVGADRPADDVRRAAVPIAPQLVADDHHGIGAGPVVAVAKPAAEDRLNAERLERGDGELAGAEALGPAVFRGQIHRREPVGPEPLERRLARLPHGDVLHGDRLARLVLREIGADDRDDAIRAGEGQAFEQAAVHDAEHGGAQADAETERQHGHDRQRRVLDQHPHARADIGNHLGDG
jgi:hypothetical protein